jgi:nitrogen fixation protein FixH
MSGKRVFYYFFAFFGVIAAMNAFMVTTAIRTHSGLVTDHPYEKGLAYNKVVAAEEAQAKLGWKGELSYTNGNLHFTLKDQNGTRLTLDKATATITRPTEQGMDFNAELTGEETPITFPAKGLWDVRVDATHEGVHFQTTKRIVVE